jgi:hypothetical protein
MDLKAAKSFGLKTLYIRRHAEDRALIKEDEEYVDLYADDFIDMSIKLGISRPSGDFV